MRSKKIILTTALILSCLTLPARADEKDGIDSNWYRQRTSEISQVNSLLDNVMSACGNHTPMPLKCVQDQLQQIPSFLQQALRTHPELQKALANLKNAVIASYNNNAGVDYSDFADARDNFKGALANANKDFSDNLAKTSKNDPTAILSSQVTLYKNLQSTVNDQAQKITDLKNQIASCKTRQANGQTSPQNRGVSSAPDPINAGSASKALAH